MSVSLTFPFTDSADYTYDAALVEVTGGSARLKEIRPTNGTFGAVLCFDINGTWGNGVLTGTSVGGAAIVSNKLDCTGGADKYVRWAALGNASTALQTGCIRLKYVPAYSGSPAADRTLASICKEGTFLNLIDIMHLAAGGLRYRFYDIFGALVISYTTPAWVPVSGTEYEIELDYDLTTRAQRLFVDGIQLGVTQAGLGTRTSNSDYVKLGGTYIAGTCDGTFSNLIVYSAVQHVADYTPGYTASLYSTTNPTIEGNASWICEGLAGFVDTHICTGTTCVQYVLKKGTSWYWWTGTAWAVSNGTYAQSSHDTDINTNAATFTIAITTCKFKAFLHSTFGATTPELSNLEITYNFSGTTPDTINKNIIWGYALKMDGTVSTGLVKVKLNKSCVKYKTLTTIINSELTDTPDATNGYWEMELIETVNMEAGTKYIFEIDGRRFTASIPDVATTAFNALTSTEV